MGIVNVTPDSFHDGGRTVEVQAAVARGLQLAREGADWLDVGGESTRPGAAPVPADEEARRVVPVIRGLRGHLPGLPISVDTQKAVVARQALEAGASAVNDVSALADPDMAAVVAAAGCDVVLMHMRGTPADMQVDPRYDDVVEDVCAWLLARVAVARGAGIAPERIHLDPGIGFGKTVEHNLALIRHLPRLVATGYPVVVGASRKSFIGRVLDLPSTEDRLEGSLAVAALAAWSGAAAIRVHDVRETRRVVDLVAAVRGQP